MRYLFSSVSIVTLSLLALDSYAQATLNYESIAHNEDVKRRINLEPLSVTEITTDIKFRTVHSQEGEKAFYYYVIPRELEENLVSITASLTTTLEEVKVTREDHVNPIVLRKYTNKNDTSDVVFFRFEVNNPKDYNGFYAFTVTEYYKRRKNPFPSVISIREHDE